MTNTGEFQSGQLIGSKYRIVAFIAQGGQGAVYKAEEIVDGMVARVVAIKTIIAGLVNQQGFLTRFIREASVMLQLKSPNSVRIVDFFQHEGSWCIAMEWLTGSKLTDELARIGIMEPAQALSIATQICDAIGEAHVLDIIHRDLKPDNIFVRPTSVSTYSVKVCDFGLASAQPGEERATNAGAPMGTPGYMSPEQVLGQEATPASDVYAIGVILFEMIVGHAPFQGSWMEKMAAAAYEDHPKLPPEILATTAGPLMQIIVDRCTRRDPALRYQTCGELRVKLDEALALLPRLGRGSSTMAVQVLPDSQPGTGQVRAVNERDSGAVIITAQPNDLTSKQEILALPVGGTRSRNTPSRPGNVAAVPAGIPVSDPDLPTIGPEDDCVPMPIHDQPTEAVSRPNSADDRPVTARPAILLPIVRADSGPQVASHAKPTRITPLPIPVPVKRPSARRVPLTTIFIVGSVVIATIMALWYLHGKIEAKVERMQIGSEVSASVVAPTALIATPVAKDEAKVDQPVKVKSSRHSLKKHDDSDDGDQQPAPPTKRDTDLKNPFSVN